LILGYIALIFLVLICFRLLPWKQSKSELKFVINLYIHLNVLDTLSKADLILYPNFCTSVSTFLQHFLLQDKASSLTLYSLEILILLLSTFLNCLNSFYDVCCINYLPYLWGKLKKEVSSSQLLSQLLNA